LRTAIAAVWATILCAFFLQTANALQTDLVSLKADSVFASSVIGLLMAAYYAGYFFAPPAGRYLIVRFGHIPTVAVSMVMTALIILVLPLLVTAPAWGFFRLLTGFALALTYVALESWINDAVPNRLRGRVFSFYLFAQMVGMTLAQGLVTFGTADNYYMFAMASGIFGLAALPVLFSRDSAPASVPPVPLSLSTLFRRSPMGAIATLAAGLTWAVLFTFGPVYAKRIGLDMSGIGLLMGISVAAGGVAQIPSGWMSDRLGRRPVLLILFGGGVAASLVAFIGTGLTSCFVATAMAGTFIFPIYAVSAAAVNDRIEPDVRVAAASGLVLLFGLGSIFGPLLCGPLMGALGPNGFFALLGAAMATGLVSTLVFAPSRAAPVTR
jgi:MFS family permease